MRIFRAIVVDLPDFQQREVALAVLRRTNEPGYRIAGAQVEAPDLAGTDVNVVGPCEIGAVGRTQKTEAVLQNLEHTIAIDIRAVARVRLENRENDVLLA